MDFDQRFQERKNGPLSQQFRDRIKRFREFSTLAEIGDTIGFSGAFVSQILNEKSPARVDSKHIPRIVRAIEKAEVEWAEELGLPSSSTAQPAAASSGGEGPMSLDYHLRAIDALGWKILGIAPKN
jgi:hypothetical protein